MSRPNPVVRSSFIRVVMCVRTEGSKVEISTVQGIWRQERVIGVVHDEGLNVTKRVERRDRLREVRRRRSGG